MSRWLPFRAPGMAASCRRSRFSSSMVRIVSASWFWRSRACSMALRTVLWTDEDRHAELLGDFVVGHAELAHFGGLGAAFLREDAPGAGLRFAVVGSGRFAIMHSPF
jgi:hypothetical protein